MRKSRRIILSPFSIVIWSATRFTSLFLGSLIKGTWLSDKIVKQQSGYLHFSAVFMSEMSSFLICFYFENFDTQRRQTKHRKTIFVKNIQKWLNQTHQRTNRLCFLSVSSQRHPKLLSAHSFVYLQNSSTNASDREFTF